MDCSASATEPSLGNSTKREWGSTTHRATEAANRLAERLEASLDCDFVMQGYADLREEASRLSPKGINEWKAALDRASAELCR